MLSPFISIYKQTPSCYKERNIYLISFFASPVMTHRAPDFGDVSSRVRWRSRPEELPGRQCSAAVEPKTKILCAERREGERGVRRRSC